MDVTTARRGAVFRAELCPRPFPHRQLPRPCPPAAEGRSAWPAGGAAGRRVLTLGVLQPGCLCRMCSDEANLSAELDGLIAGTKRG